MYNYMRICVLNAISKDDKDMLNTHLSKSEIL